MNDHVSTLEAFLDNLPIFEKLLNYAEKNNGRDREKLVTYLTQEEMGDLIPLISNQDDGFINFISDLAYQMLKLYSKQCYYCSHKPEGRGSDVSKSLYGHSQESTYLSDGLTHITNLNI